MLFQRCARRAPVVAVFLAAVAAVAVGARQTQQTPPARTLAAGAATIAIDFLAIGRDGMPILDLKPEEVTLRIDNKQRVIRSLTLMHVGEGSDVSSQPTSEPPPAPFATNALSGGGRAFVLMIDDESLSIGNEALLRNSVSSFLTGLSSRDRVAVVTLPHGGLKLDFTSDRAAVRQTLSAIGGHYNDRETSTEIAIRTRATLQQLTNWLGNLSGHGPTTVVVFSSSLMGVRGTLIQARGAREGGESLGTGQIREEDFEYVGRAAAEAKAQVYVVQHDQVVASRIGGGNDSQRFGLENLTGVTGGPLFSLAGPGGETALTRVARETSAYWVVTFDAEPNERNDLSHAVNVRVARDGATVRVRPIVPIPRPEASAARPSPTTPRALLMESRIHRELGLRTAAYSSRNPDGQIKIVAIAETTDPGKVFAAAEFAIFDASGHMLRQWAPPVTDLNTDRLIGAFSGLPKGTYRMRLAATDAAGNRGTVDAEVVAELPSAGPLRMSDLVVGLSRDGRFAPRLQFSTEPVALAYLDLYGAQAGMEVAVIIEVAQGLNRPAFMAFRPVVDPTSESDRFNVTAAIPIGSLPPGDYVIRAIVSQKDQPEGRSFRTLRKVQ